MSKCDNGYQCVLDFKTCDGVADCADSSDEDPDLCVESKFI